MAVLGSGVQGRSHVDAMQTVLDDPIIRIWSRNGDHAEALALETHSLVAGSIEEALAGADIVCTATSTSEPFVELEWLAPGTHINAAGAFPDGKSRELSTATVAASRFFVDRRESTLNEAGDYRVAAAERGFGPEHIVGELGRAPQRHRRGPALGRRADGVQVDGNRGRGSRRGAALRGAGARARRRRRGRLLIPLADIEAARERIADVVLRTPLVRLQVPESPAEIWLKLECLQPIGSFKIRGAANAIRSAPPGAVDRGVLTTSAGNMAQGVAWMARELGVPATVVAPEHAPQTKLDAIARLGGTVIKVPYERWWQTMEEGSYPGVDGYFVHPVLDDAVMAGNGTIGLELVEDLDAIDTVLVPWGGGGLTTGIASALAALSPATRVLACEPETGAPLAASFAAGSPVEVDYTASFVDGAGSKALLGPMWDSAHGLLAGGITLTLDETAAAVRPWPSGRAWSRRAPERSPSRRRSPGGPARDGSSASSRAATSMPPGSPRFSRATPPPDRPQHATSRRRPSSLAGTRSGSAVRRLPGRPASPPSTLRENRSMRTVSLTALRRIAIAAQGYATRSRAGSTREVEAAIRRLSCVQLDSISAVERSHRIALASRVGAYKPGIVPRLLGQGRVFEYWAHEACLLPVEEWPLFVAQMQRRRAPLVRRTSARRIRTSRTRSWPRSEPAARSARATSRERARVAGCGTGSRRRRCSTASGTTATS